MRAVTENKNSRHFSNLLAKPDIFELCLAFLPDDMLEIVFSTLIHAKIFTIPRPLSTAAESDRGTVMIHPQLTIAIVKRNSLNTFVRLPRVTLELIQQPDLDASTRLHLMLNNTDPNDRYLSSLIKQLIPTLLAKLNDEYSDRAAACNTLVTILVTTQLSPEIRNRIIPALLKKLDDWNSNMRAAACNALATLQLPPEFHNQIISALLKKLDDRASDVRAAACNALTTFQLSPEFHNQIIPTLLEKLYAWNSDVRAAACNALATLQLSLSPEFRNQIISTPLEKLNNENFYVRVKACETLATLVTTQLFSKFHNQIISALLKKLDDRASNVCAAACKALATLVTTQLFSKFHNQIIPTLLEKLNAWNSDVRAAACKALATFQLSPEFHNQIIPTLLEKLNDEDFYMRAAARNALATLQLSPEFHNQIIPTLLEKLNDRASDVRAAACNALTTFQLSPEFHNQIIPTLLEKLNAWNSDVRAAACNALATLQLSPEFHNQIIPTLLEKLNDESFYVRTEACKALATLDITGHLSTEKIENIATNLLELAHSNNHDIGNQALSVLLLLMTHHPRLLEDKKIASSNNAIKLKIAAHAMQYAIPSLHMLSLSKNSFLKATAAYKTSHDAKVKKINSITTELNTALEKYFKESGQRTPALQQNIKTLFEELIVIVCLEKNRLTVPFFQTKKSHSITTHSAKQLINYFKLPQSIHMRNALADIFSFQSRVDGASQTVNWRDTTQFNAALTQLMNQTLATRTSQSENILASVASVTPS